MRWWWRPRSRAATCRRSNTARSARGGLMFRRLPDVDAATVEVTIDGHSTRVYAGDTVAAALISAGVLASRAADVSGAPRAPYCLMGVCFESVVTVDGVANRQGCLVPVRPGMRIETQHGKREVGR